MLYDVVVIGAGAAGLMCAIEAGKRGRRVAVIEHSLEVGRKILISGGGRCNFTNIHCAPENFLCTNPHFPKSALARYTPSDFIELVRKHRIPYHEKKLGQLFCDRSARDITTMLEQECRAAGVEIVLDCPAREVRRATEFVVETKRGAFSAAALVIASGGLSIPKIGATDFGYRIARQFGHKVCEPRPALVPLTFSATERRNFGDLAGVSTEVVASADKRQFREKMLFTHRGLSGPAILQISSYWTPGGTIAIDLLPGVDIAGELARRRQAGEKALVRTVLGEFLPSRLAERWMELHGPSKPVAACAEREQEILATGLHRWELRPAGTEGYEKAEVTAGGVDTARISSKTMESAEMPGLFFIGEVLDVTGHLGGFNFQWAWASGAAAGRAV